MPTYNVSGWIWAGLNTPTTLLPVTITDDGPDMSAYFTDDFTETLNIGGTTYTNPQGGTYQLTFEDSDGDTHIENFLLFSTGSNFIFIPMPGSEFDNGSEVTVLGGWQEWTTGFAWDDVVCFVAGTYVVTPTGARLIETLEVGDLVLTKDNGIQAIRWIGRKALAAQTLRAAPHLQPVTIKKDAFGAGVPKRDLQFSPQHRVLISNPSLEKCHGSNEVLVPAKGLLDGQTAVQSCGQGVEYIHILFDRHEIVFTEGLASESFQPGSVGIDAIDMGARAELFELFPQLQYGLESYGPTARPSLTVQETRAMFI